ncbi:MAG: ABC transporter ATP-binding protein [Bacteroidales bacterium]|nr:ABC transporter ATP-binding protein [Bacteroidales bacterium]
MIRLQNISKIYKNSTEFAVNEISLNINKGEIFGLLGTNGAGKTTIFSMLCGLFPPTSGEIYINNLSVRTQISEIKKIIGVVPQNIALYPTLTAKENLSFFGKMYGLRGKELTNSIIHRLEIFGLTKYADKKIKTYSGGMKRRINLIAGILHKPELLLLDEPAVGIDAHSRLEIMHELKKINESGTSIIYTSHYLEEAEKFCSEIAIIDKGKIITQGKPTELVKSANCSNLEEMFFKLTGNKSNV